MPSPAASVQTRYWAPPSRPRLAEELDLLLALAGSPCRRGLGDLAGEAQALQPPDEEVERVAVLGEDDQLLVAELGVAQDLAELVELRLVPPGVDLRRQLQERSDLLPLGLQLRERDGDDAAQRLVLGDLVLLPAALGRLLVAGLLLEDVLGVVELPLQLAQSSSA